MPISFGESAGSTSNTSGTNLNADTNEVFTALSAYDSTWYPDYADDDMQIVSSSKNITISANQPNLSQETNSQYIPFIMPRYYDGIDLATMIIQIHFVNANKEDYYTSPVNVEASETRIRFGWLVDERATAYAGTLQFEIKIIGTTSNGLTYIWRTRPNAGLTVEKSLEGNGVIQPENYTDWYTSFELAMNTKVASAQAAVSEAQIAAAKAKQYAESIDVYSKTDIDNMLSGLNSLSNLGAVYDNNVLMLFDKSKEASDENYVLATVNNIDTLNNLDVTYTNNTQTGVASLNFYDGNSLIKSVDLDFTPSTTWQANFATSLNGTIDSKISAYNANTVQPALTTIRSDLSDLSQSVGNLPTTLQSDYYTKDQVDAAISSAVGDAVDEETVNSIINTNSTVTGLRSDLSSTQADVTNLDSRVTTAEGDIATLRTSMTAHNVYDITYDTDTNVLSLFENEDPTQEGATPKTSVTITGGGGGGGTQPASTLTVTRITPDNITVTTDSSSVDIRYNFTSVTSDGDTNSITGTAVWKVGNTAATSQVVATERDITQGDKSFNILPYLSVGTKIVTLVLTDSEGSIATRRWTVNLIDFNVSSSFDDSIVYDSAITFRYTPNGAIDKTIHFVLDNIELDPVATTYTARQLSYTIQKQAHGAHSLDVFMTATINGENITSNHLKYDIVFIDESNSNPIVACSTKQFTAKQYDVTPIKYLVYDPLSNLANVVLYVDDEPLPALTVDRTAQTWSYKTSEIGTHTLKIECANRVSTASVTITATIESIGIDINPITDNLVFDFNPAGMSNASNDRLWSDGTYHMTVSSNFDWANGGYQIDSDGDTYFCIKAGTTASFDVPLFGDEAKTAGKNFKFIYRTNNVRNYDAQVLRCMSGGIGLEMDAQSAVLHSQQNSIEAPYCEDNFMEFEFNILPSSPYREMVLWLDAIPTRVKLYETTDSFTQITTVPITIGSNDCDVWVYRMKSYSAYLEEDEVLTNFIADAKNSDTMIARYRRNDILNNAGNLDPDLLAEKCPDLRIIKLSAPWFTNDKDNKVSGTTVQHIYKNGREVEDNWIATGGIHKGQGTSSNYYGDSARNIDIDFRKAYNVENGTGFTYGDGTLHAKYAMTDNSVEEAYFNIKLNVASSESANNAVLADDYNIYNPYVRPARRSNPKVRDTMEFHPCAVFIQETDPDLSKHREFQDTDWHFYGCGDFGNSKKNNAAMGMTDDPDEFIMEVNNNINPQCRWLSDDLSTETWNSKGSFQLRYIKDEDDVEMNDAAKAVWKTHLTWVVDQYKANVLDQLATLDAAIEAATTPEDIESATAARDTYMSNFKSQFEQHFQANNLCYSYLFTERHLMIDNRAKNTFWHYDPTTELLSCTFDYDNDTAEGNDNEGGLTLRYGLEDTDTIGQKDVYNAADSFIWKLIKHFYRNELATMYRNLENNGAWSATRFLNKMEAYQGVKPERLWIYDMQRKYFRPYEEGGITEETDSKPSTTAYLDMMHGSKKHQRRQFEKYQEKYIASKYVGTTATSDVLTLRTYTPSTWAGVEPSTTFHIIPYADTYIVISYGGTQVQKRAVRGQEYAISAPPGTRVNDTETYCYNASMLQSLGDLSAFYPGYVNLAGGVKLRDLLIGSNATGYSNTNFTSVSVSANPLLERLNLQNLPSLAMSINVESCANMTQLLADGSAITGIVLPTGGKINTVHLPDTIASFTAKSLYYLNDLTIDGYSNIATLVIEYSPSIDSLEMINLCTGLTTARILGVNWQIDDDSVLERIYNMRGLDENHNAIARAILTGNVAVGTIRERNLAKYQEAWPNLTITYTNLINQYTVRFYNAEDENGEHELLDTQYVDVNGLPEDPSTREVNKITPTLTPTISTVYTFSGWDHPITTVSGEQNYIAVYDEAPRTYTVTYTNGFGTVLQRTTGCPYGSYVPYIGTNGVYSNSMSVAVSGSGAIARADAYKDIIPTYTGGEAANSFNIFVGWDKSGYVNGYTDSTRTTVGNKVINAVYDNFLYSSSGSTNSFTDSNGVYKPLNTLSPVEVYAMKQLASKSPTPVIIANNDNDVDSDDFIAIGDSITIPLGHDINYSDIESHEFVSMNAPLNLNGATNLDTSKDENHSDYSALLSEDRDFVIALEYMYNNNSNVNDVMMQCYNDARQIGLKVSYNGVNWYGSNANIVSSGFRNIIVLRHAKGDSNLYVYNANIASDNVSVTTLTNSTTTNIVTSDLVFGSAKTGQTYSNYAMGTIYWAKIWTVDLGDAACKELASWTHEQMTFKVAKYKDYYKSDETKTLFTFIASTLLPVNHVMGSYNWHGSSLEYYLQNRLFFALPVEYQSILAKTTLNSWDGYITKTIQQGNQTINQSVKSTTITMSDAYVFIPCAAEVNSGASYDEQLSRECYKGLIKYFASNSGDLVGRYPDGYGGAYFTRSCSANNADYVNVVTYDYNSDSASFASWETPSNSNGIRIMFSI